MAEYQGGGDAVLTGFYNTLNSAFARNTARIAQRDQAEAKANEEYQKNLTQIMGKVNPAGVQTVDVGELAEKQSRLKELYFQAGKATSSKERLELTAQLQQGITDLGQFITASKTRGQEQYKLGEYLGNPQNMGLISPDAKTRYEQLINTPTSKLQAGSLSTNNFTLPDTSYLGKVFDQTAKDMLGRAGEKIRVGGQVNFGNGGSGTQIFTERDVKQEAFGTALFDIYNRDTKAKNLVDYTASQMGLQPQQYLAQVAQQYAKRGQLRTSNVNVQANPRPEKEPKVKKDDNLTYRQQTIEGLLSNDRDALGRIRATLLPGATVNYVKSPRGQTFIRIETPDTDLAPGAKSDIRITDPNAFTKLNTLLNVATGERVSASKAGILKGKTSGQLAEPTIRKSANSNVSQTTIGTNKRLY